MLLLPPSDRPKSVVVPRKMEYDRFFLTTDPPLVANQLHINNMVAKILCKDDGDNKYIDSEEDIRDVWQTVWG